MTQINIFQCLHVRVHRDHHRLREPRALGARLHLRLRLHEEQRVALGRRGRIKESATEDVKCDKLWFRFKAK